MSKKNIIIVAAVAILAVAIGTTYGGDLFKGNMFRPSSEKSTNLYNQNGRTVSVVATPVPSILVSNVGSRVTSRGGTSKVTSRVPSVVVSPVASGVPTGNNGGVGKLKKLTPQDLIRIAKEVMKREPRRFELSKDQIKEMLNKYKQKLPTPPKNKR